MQSSIRGDPEAALLWVSKSQRHLAGALSQRSFTASQKLVGRLLRGLGFSLQANRKTREGASHPDRNAQFEHINAQINAFQAAGQPTISVDTKKKELVGDFKNGRRELRPKGDPEPVRVHDFMIPELGKVAPYGVYDIAANAGWIQPRHHQRHGRLRSGKHPAPVAGTRAIALRGRRTDTDHGGLRRQQRRAGTPLEDRVADAGRSDGFVHSVAHLPPGTSKWNRIEHRLFAFITQNWRGKPLLTHQVIVQLIASTTTQKGLTVQCRLDRNTYDKGIKVSDAEMARLNINPAEFHGEWNYTIKLRKPDI